MSDCSHVFIGTPKCQLCGITELQLLRRERADAFRLLSEQAVAIHQARELLLREGTVQRDDLDHIEARSAWLARNPAPTKKPNTSTPA